MEKLIELAKQMEIKRYQKIRKYALMDDYLAHCLEDGMNVTEIELCEYMHHELCVHGELINFPHTW